MPQSMPGGRRLRMPTFRRPWKAIVRRCARAVLAAWVLNFFAATADAQPLQDTVPDGYVGGP